MTTSLTLKIDMLEAFIIKQVSSFKRHEGKGVIFIFEKKLASGQESTPDTCTVVHPSENGWTNLHSTLES